MDMHMYVRMYLTCLQSYLSLDIQCLHYSNYQAIYHCIDRKGRTVITQAKLIRQGHLKSSKPAFRSSEAQYSRPALRSRCEGSHIKIP